MLVAGFKWQDAGGWMLGAGYKWLVAGDRLSGYQPLAASYYPPAIRYNSSLNSQAHQPPEAWGPGGQAKQRVRIFGFNVSAKVEYSTIPTDLQGNGARPLRRRVCCTRHSTMR